MLDGAVRKVADAAAEAARTHDLGPDVPVVALGGAGPVARAGEVARRLGRPLLRPAHPEVLSSIGAALSLVRAEAVRHASGPGDGAGLARDAGRACVAAGAAPLTVAVQTALRAARGLLRAVATGAVALEAGAAVARAARRGRPARRRRHGRGHRARGAAARRGDRLLPRLRRRRHLAGDRRRRPRDRARVRARAEHPHRRGPGGAAGRAARARSTRGRRTSASPPSCPASASSRAPRSSTSATAAARRTSSRARPPRSARARGRPWPSWCADGPRRDPPRRAGSAARAA